MIRVILKLALAALIANAAWRTGTTYAAFYKFKDSVAEASEFGGDKSEDQLRARILELAAQYDVPITETSFTVRRQENRTYVDGSYTQPVEVFPGYRYPFPFSWTIETLTNQTPRIPPLRNR